jgi:NTE family protein
MPMTLRCPTAYSRNIPAVLLLVMLCLQPVPVHAREQGPRPRVGLVLGGGGAKGAAHVGVLKVLEELRIPVDCIAGTSMGAIVGGMYASGMSPAEIEQFLVSQDWNELFTDEPDRKDIGFRRKSEDFLNLSKFTIGYRDGSFRAAKAIFEAEKIGILFETTFLPVAGTRDFDRLPIPFRAVAADLETGQMVVIGSGRLAEAVRASMSLPGIFPPAEIAGRYLTDGGIVRNLPVDVVRSLGADIVIAVDVGKPFLRRDDLHSSFAIMDQSMDIMIKNNVLQQVALLDERDVLIRPDLGTIGTEDFERGAEAAKRGEEAARLRAEALSRYSIPGEEYAVFTQRQRRPPVSSVRVGAVSVEGLERVSPEAVMHRFGTRPGEELDPAALQRRVGPVYGMGDFERIDLRVDPRGDVHDISLRVHEKPWGPNYLRFGLSLESSFDGGSEYTVLVDYTMRWVNRLGAEWKNQIEFGGRHLFFSEFYQPLFPKRTLFVAPYFRWEQRFDDVFYGDDVLAQYRIRQLQWGADLGVQPWTYGEVRFGYVRDEVQARPNIGLPGFPGADLTQGALRFRAIADQVDSVAFPRRGYFAWLNYYTTRESLGAAAPYDKIEAAVAQALTFDRYSIVANLQYGTHGGEVLPFYDLHTLGGFFNLSAYQRNQLAGQVMAFGKLVAYRQARPTVVGSVLGKFYMGGSLEAGNVWERTGDMAWDDLHLSASAFVGYDTLFGPLYVGVAVGDRGHETIFLYLGTGFKMSHREIP